MITHEQITLFCTGTLVYGLGQGEWCLSNLSRCVYKAPARGADLLTRNDLADFFVPTFQSVAAAVVEDVQKISYSLRSSI